MSTTHQARRLECRLYNHHIGIKPTHLQSATCDECTQHNVLKQQLLEAFFCPTRHLLSSFKETNVYLHLLQHYSPTSIFRGYRRTRKNLWGSGPEDSMFLLRIGNARVTNATSSSRLTTRGMKTKIAKIVKRSSYMIKRSYIRLVAGQFPGLASVTRQSGIYHAIVRNPDEQDTFPNVPYAREKKIEPNNSLMNFCGMRS
uniref:Uncharacterized protein n=1 Tax=Glossina pallidipes TaxID=7398 RepID=A0A1A9ZK93_GLOPL